MPRGTAAGQARGAAGFSAAPRREAPPSPRLGGTAGFGAYSGGEAGEAGGAWRSARDKLREANLLWRLWAGTGYGHALASRQ